MLPDWIAALAAAFAAAAAAWQIRQSRLESRKRLAFQYIGDAIRRLELLWAHDDEVMKNDLLGYFRGERAELSEGAANYLAFLTAADLLAFAVLRSAADPKIATEYFETLLRHSLLSPSFLKEFQGCCGDDQTLAHLFQLSSNFRRTDK